MAGRHRGTGLRARRTRVVLVGAVLLALAVGAAAAWPHHEPAAPTAALAPATGVPVPAPVPAPTATASGPERDAERSARGSGARAAAPQQSPPPEPEPESAGPSEPPRSASQPGQHSSDPVPDSGQVVTTGTCEASYYWEPQPTASGEVFDPEAMTAAHKTWDFGTRVRVTNPANEQSVVVRINDRGPYIDGRCLDLARGAFREIASLQQGVATVTYEVLSD